MKTKEINTRSMQGLKDVDGEIFNILCSHYSMDEIFESKIADEDAIYSRGFINAIEMGLIPTLEVVSNHALKGDIEYHHFILNDECYCALFTNN